MKTKEESIVVFKDKKALGGNMVFEVENVYNFEDILKKDTLGFYANNLEELKERVESNNLNYVGLAIRADYVNKLIDINMEGESFEYESYPLFYPIKIYDKVLYEPYSKEDFPYLSSIMGEIIQYREKDELIYETINKITNTKREGLRINGYTPEELFRNWSPINGGWMGKYKKELEKFNLWSIFNEDI